MTKYRLKKDTPFYKKGTEFSEDLMHKGVLLNDDCLVVANLNELDNPDEWFEEVKESGWWKPRLGEHYYYIGPNGGVYSNQWENDSIDNARLKLGSVFKTEEATRRWRDYLKAVETVRHDEGFMKPHIKNEYGEYGYGIRHVKGGTIAAESGDNNVVAGGLYFDTREHAQASLEAHRPEWETILNYDWSKGEDENEHDN